MLIFSNPGIINPLLITTFGANIKSSPSAIGTFGTGLKYAIAVALRSGAKLCIHSGEFTYDFILSPQVILGKTLDFICMETRSASYQTAIRETEPSSQTLAFTSNLGKNWKPWMVYRELWSNAQDEGGVVTQAADDTPVVILPTHTHILVSNWPDLDACHATRADFLLTPKAEPLWQSPDLAVYSGRSSAIYYRGIKVQSLDKPSLYTYNVLSEQTLTEDRTLDDWHTRYAVVKAIGALPDQDIAETILLASGDNWESKLDFDYCGGLSQEFIRAIQKAKSHRLMNRSARTYGFTHYRDEFLPVPVEATGEQLKVLAQVQEFFTTLAIPVKWSTTIVALLDEESDLTHHHDSILYISPKALDLERGPAILAVLSEWAQSQSWNGLKMADLVLQLGDQVMKWMDEDEAQGASAETEEDPQGKATAPAAEAPTARLA